MFLDFHLMVSKIQGEDDEGFERFVTVVADCPALRFSESFGQFTLRKSDLDLWQAGNMRLSFSRDGENRFQIAEETKRERSDENIGEDLFRLLFTPHSVNLDLLGRSCEMLGRHDYLRLKLELHHQLSNIPWELLECPGIERWAMQINRAKLSIIRFLGNTLGSRITATGLKTPSIVIVKADPEESARRNVTESLSRELDYLKSTLDRLAPRVNYHVVEHRSTLSQLVDLVGRLRSTSPVIGLHLMGHGGVDHRGGYFAGEDGERKLHPIYARDLRNGLIEAPSIRWVILNACWTGHEPFANPLAGLATSMAMLKDVPTVIAYQRPVQTKDAEKLAADFYEQVIGQERPVEEVIRSVKSRSGKRAGLIVLARAVNGQIQDVIRLRAPRERREQRQRHKAVPAPMGPSHPPLRPAPLPHRAQMLPVSAGPFKKGLTPEQIDFLVAQLRHKGRLDMESVRGALEEEPQATVDLPDFRIDETLVTNSQFALFVETTQYRTDAEREGDPLNWRLHEGPEKTDHPVVYVSYNDAEAFCRWAGKRLPTADQWKKAYRGPDGRIYPWGGSFDSKRCNTAESHQESETTPVSMYPNGASPYGCLDMVGNVEEWTATSYDDDKKVILGGSWALSQIYGLPVLQRLASPNYYSNDIGFRCVE